MIHKSEDYLEQIVDELSGIRDRLWWIAFWLFVIAVIAVNDMSLGGSDDEVSTQGNAPAAQEREGQPG